MVRPTTSPQGSPTLSGGTTPGRREGTVVVVVDDAVASLGSVESVGAVVSVPATVVVSPTVVVVVPFGSAGTRSAPATQAVATMAMATAVVIKRRIGCECRNGSVFCSPLIARILKACAS
jgi:hypothetical protein